MSEASALKTQVDTLKHIQKTAVEAAGAKGKVEIVQPEPERGERYLVVDGEGSFDWITPPTPRRVHDLHSLAEFPGYLKYAMAQLTAKPVVWYSDTEVIAVLDDSPTSFRRDSVRLAFANTPEFDWLQSASDGGSAEMTQKQLVFLLRSTLSACATPSSAELLAVARDLSAKTSTTAGGRVGNTRESLGRDIESEVRSDVGEIPELVDFRVRVLTDPLMTVVQSVHCIVEINPQTLAIQLFPRPEDIRLALEETLHQVGDYLDRECASETCQVFYGAPGAR